MELVTLEKDSFHFKSLRFGQQKFNLHEANHELTPNALHATPGSADLCLITETSISDVILHLQRHNVIIEKGPVIVTGTLGRMESVYFRDPDGNLIEISNYQVK